MASVIRSRWFLAAVGALAALVTASILLAVFSDSEPVLFDPGDQDISGLSGLLLFANSCAQCHGTLLTGTTTGPPLVHQFYRPSLHPDESFIVAIRLGVRNHHWQYGNMPPIANLSDAEIAAIIRFIRAAQVDGGVR